MNVNDLFSLIEQGDPEAIAQFMMDNDLSLVENKIQCNDPEMVNDEYTYWDKRQLVKKINLNS